MSFSWHLYSKKYNLFVSPFANLIYELLTWKLTSEEQHFITAKHVLPSVFNYHISKSVPLKKWRFLFFFSHCLRLPLWSQPTKLLYWITIPVTGSWMYLTLENSWDTVKWDTFCASWICCLISTHNACLLEGEGLNPNWWFISVQLSHQLWSHIVLVFSLWPLLSKLCHPLTRTGCWCLARTCAAACSLWNKCSQLSTAKQPVLPDNRRMASATGKSEPANLCWDTGTLRWNASSWGLLLETRSKGVLWPAAYSISKRTQSSLNKSRSGASWLETQPIGNCHFCWKTSQKSQESVVTRKKATA